MARKKRNLKKETLYHVFNRGVAKMPIVKDETDRRIFFKFMGKAVIKYGCQLMAYCLMDNHFHLMIKTGDVDLDKILWHIQSKFSRRINLRHERVGTLFQGRYQSRVLDSDAYVLCVLRYIHLNPVEAGLVKKPEDYLWSSYQFYLNQSLKPTWLNVEWCLQLLDMDKKRSIDTFVKFHGQKESDLSVAWPLQ